MQLHPELEKSLNRAIQFATEKHNEFVSLEHLLLSMCEDKEITEILEGCGAKPSSLKGLLQKFISEHSPKVSDAEVKDPEWKPMLTLAFHRVLQRAIVQVQSADRSKVRTANVLISLFREEDSHAVSFLQSLGVSRFDVINYFSHGVSKEEADSVEEESETPALPGSREETKGDPLESFALNLNERAKSGLVDPLIGREDIIERTLQVLSRRTKNHVLLVGDPGVGKTAIADGLALKIVKGEVPDKLKDAEIFSLDMGSILAGTKFRGDFEARVKSVIKKLSEKKHAILFIDEMHTVVGAGSASGGSVDASNLLKPALLGRNFSCIGSTTYKEFKYLEKDQALIRRFQKIDVKPPTAAETVQILKGLRSRYEEFHAVEYPDDVIEEIVKLSERFISGRPFPDKAIDVMDEVAARLRLKSTSDKPIKVTRSDVEDVVAFIAQVPKQSVGKEDREQIKNLEVELKKVIFGQDKAIDELVASIKLSRSGLASPNKPIGCYLFAGPTGVGKTEVAKQLAKCLGTELIRFDMSEYMEKHSVSRLVGAPPGYVGFDEGGLLTEAVSRVPYAVLLFDEMEKAHPDLSNILLQVMDGGKLTDTNGKTVDFRNIILIMTSNAGARELGKQGIGIVPKESGQRSVQAVKQAFAPEFVNRLDAIIGFSELSKEVVLLVVDKFLKELSTQLEPKGVRLKVSDKARQYLLTKGYDSRNGARPMARAIQEEVKKKIVDELLFGALSNKPGTIDVDEKSGELQFKFKAAKE